MEAYCSYPSYDHTANILINIASHTKAEKMGTKVVSPHMMDCGSVRLRRRERVEEEIRWIDDAAVYYGIRYCFYFGKARAG